MNNNATLSTSAGWVINQRDIILKEEIGSGEFGGAYLISPFVLRKSAFIAPFFLFYYVKIFKCTANLYILIHIRVNFNGRTFRISEFLCLHGFDHCCECHAPQPSFSL